ncbi:MAG TPA: PLP-dependent aminotransferase family protein [Ktedonobacterales bacterium]
MPKRAAIIAAPDIFLDPSIAAPLYRQLYERLRAHILTGQLEIGARLPSTRALAGQLGVSRNTTALAYDMLLSEGYIESRVGDGARVARTQPEQAMRAPRHRLRTRAEALSTQPVALARRGQTLLDTPHPGTLYGAQTGRERHTFRGGEPDVASFPFETWTRLLTRHARHSLPSAALYQPAHGYLPLREAIAAHIGITRGVRCSPEQVIITSGSQGALDLVARTLLDPGDSAWVEDPGYLGARGALLAAGARLVPVPVDRDGLQVTAGRVMAPDARLAVITPSHQFPTGVTMSLSRRLALLSWAREARAWIVEDDYDSEYRYSGRPLEALQGIDRAGVTVYIGTFSKTLFPALRLGYLVAPPALVDGLIATRRFVDVHLPPLDQMALADFIAEGHYARRLRRTRLLYMQRRDALYQALTKTLGAQLEVDLPEAGMHLVAWLPETLRAGDVANRAAAVGISVMPIIGSEERPLPREGLLFGFAGAPPDELREGVRALAKALRTT